MQQHITYQGYEQLLSTTERSFFDTLFLSRTDKVYIAVSGGPDSMALAQLIFDSFYTNSLDLSRLVILYVDHGTGLVPVTHGWLQTYFGSLPVVSFCVSKNTKKTETTMRLARRQFFLQQLQGEPGILCTGHTLTDRIETTLLNLIRGTQRKGLVNMTSSETVTDYTTLSTPVTYTHLRPLLGYDKKTIEQQNKDHGIPFFVDPSNTESTYTMRNALRKKYCTADIPHAIRQSWQKIYHQGELVLQQKKEATWLPYTHPFLHIEGQSWYTPLPIHRQELSCLLSRQKFYNSFTQAGLEELWQYITNTQSGYRLVQGWWLCVAKKNLYIFPAHTKEPFRKTTHQDIGTWDNEQRKATLGNIHWTVSETKIIPPDALVRYPQTGDHYHGKLFSKYMSKKGLPFFLRPRIPVIAQGKEILDYFLCL